MLSEVSDLLTPSNAMRLIQNLDDDVLGILRVRPGVTAIGDVLQANKPVLGLYYFKDSAGGANSQLIASSNNGADGATVTKYLNGSNVWATIAGTFTANAVQRFETFSGYVFTVDSKFDAPKSWNGVAGSWDTTHLLSAPAGQFIKAYKSRLHIACTAANPTRILFSSIIDISGNITWTVATDYLDIPGEDITGLENNGTLLLIFKYHSMYRWNGSSTDADRVIDVGCSSNESIATRNGLTFFFNPNGIYQTDGGRPVRISKPVQRWIDAIDPAYYTKVSGTVDANNYYCSIGDVTVDGVAYTNVMLVRSLSNSSWRVRTYAKEIRRMAPYVTSTGLEALMVGTDVGDVQRFNSGLTDAGTAIPYRILTKRLDFVGSFIHEKAFSEIHAFGKGINAQTIVHTEEDTRPQSIGTILKSWWMKANGYKFFGRWFVFELSGLSSDQTGGSEFWGWEIGNSSSAEGSSKGSFV